MRKIIVCDVETGGLFHETDALCSITLKEFRKPRYLNLFIKPTKLKYNKDAMKINGMTKDILREHGVIEREAIRQVNLFLENEKVELLGQHTKFDYLFLQALFHRHKKHELFKALFSWRLRDTMPLAMFFHDAGKFTFESFKLEEVYKVVFGEELKHAHTSLGDVKATERLYDYFLSLSR